MRAQPELSWHVVVAHPAKEEEGEAPEGSQALIMQIITIIIIIIIMNIVILNTKY